MAVNVGQFFHISRGDPKQKVIQKTMDRTLAKMKFSSERRGHLYSESVKDRNPGTHNLEIDLGELEAHRTY